jgi:hypothetical protein
MLKVSELIKIKSLTLNHETEVAPDVIEDIKNTILGNPDGIRYRHLDSIKKIHEIKPLQFFTLRRDGNLLFVMALVERITALHNIFYYTYNVRYVTFNQMFSTKTLTIDNNAGRYQKIGNSFIKEGMRKHAENFEFDLKDYKALPDKKLYYAYVEDSNLRSMNFTEFFFEPIRKFTIISYSSFFPRLDKQVSKTNKDELSSLQLLLNDSFKNHSFYFTESIDLLEHYFVLKQGDNIVAGVKAQKANWKLEQLPGTMGKLIIKVLPYLPGFSRIIKPSKFCFLTFDTIYCPSGNEKYLNTLFESVCAELKVYSAMIYVDKEDELCARLLSLKKMGILNKLFSNACGNVLARFVNFSDEEKSVFYNNPVYLSGYDMT